MPRKKQPPRLQASAPGFGAALKGYLAACEVTQRDFSNQIEATPAQVNRYLSGETIPQLDKVERIGDALGASVTYLAGVWIIEQKTGS